MLIFDSFTSKENAAAFALETGGKVYESQVESHQVDPYPFALFPPVVLVPRGKGEGKVIRRVKRYGGEFAGT